MPAAAAKKVFNRMPGTASSSTRLLPPLKPCQPNPNNNAPKTDSGKLLGANFLALPSTNLPLLGPIIRIIARPIHPPVECTIVDPAKSTKPRSYNQPVDPSPQNISSLFAHAQWPTIGYKIVPTNAVIIK